MISPRKILMILAAAGALASVACGEYEGELAETGAEPAISFEDFLAGLYREPWEGGKYIVDGDIALADEHAVRAYYDSYVPAQGALTVDTFYGDDNVWEYPNQFRLTYCVSDSFGSDKANVVNTMARAAASWHDQIGARFEYVPAQDGSCNASNNNVMFDVRPVSASYFARAFFPHDARSARNVLITDSAMTTTSGGRDFEGILRHELGHTLGFRHEHIWLSDPCTSEAPDSEPNHDARQLTSYDVNSIMHYPQCRPSGGGGYRQTATDYTGARSLYGLAPGQIKAAVSSLL